MRGALAAMLNAHIQTQMPMKDWSLAVIEIEAGMLQGQEVCLLHLVAMCISRCARTCLSRDSFRFTVVTVFCFW